MHQHDQRDVEQICGLLGGDAATERVRAEAYAAYDADLRERWRGPGNPAPSAPKTFDSREDALAAAYGEYDAAIAERWRGQPNPPARRAEHGRPAPQTFESAEAARAAAYAEYDRTICERWRR